MLTVVGFDLRDTIYRSMEMKQGCVIACVAVLAEACTRGSSVGPAPPQVETATVHPSPTDPAPTDTITVGETVRSVVASDDPHCDTVDPTKEELDAPCKTFEFTAPRTGTLAASLSWSNSDTFLELLTPLYGRCCRSPLLLTFGVQAGEKYILSVGFHGTAGAGPRDGRAAFELTTSLTP